LRKLFVAKELSLIRRPDAFFCVRDKLDFSQKLNVPSRGGQRGTSDRSRRLRERSRASTSCGPCFQQSSSDPWRLTSRKARSGQWLEWGTGALSGLQCGDRRLCTPCRSFQHHSG